MFVPTKELNTVDNIKVFEGFLSHDGEYMHCYMMVLTNEDDSAYYMYYKENTPENLEHFKTQVKESES